MANESLVMTAEVRDNFSSTLRKLQNELKSLSATGATSTKTLRQDWKGVAVDIQGASGTIVRDMLPAMRLGNLAGLSLGAAIGGAAIALKNFAQNTMTLGNFSKEIGLASREVAKLQAMGGFFGIDQSTMQGNLRTFQTFLQAMKKDGGATIDHLRQVFGSAGDQLAGILLKPGNFKEKMEAAFTAIRNVDSEPTARKMAQELFGNEAWATAIRNMTPELQAAFTRIAAKIDENKDAAVRFNVALLEWSVTVENLKTQAFTPLLKVTTELMDKWRNPIENKFKDFAADINLVSAAIEKLISGEYLEGLKQLGKLWWESHPLSTLFPMNVPRVETPGSTEIAKGMNKRFGIPDTSTPGSPAKDIPKTNEELRQTNEKVNTSTGKLTLTFEKFLAIIGQGGDAAGFGPGMGGVSAGGGGGGVLSAFREAITQSPGARPSIRRPGAGGGAFGSSANLGPAPAGLLDNIARAEGTAGPNGYNTSLGYGRFMPGGKEQNLEGKTLSEILQIGNQMRQQPGNPNSSAMGRYQIVGSTLRRAANALGMDLDKTKFDRQTQDKMAHWIARAQGHVAWEGFKTHPQERSAFNAALARGDKSGGNLEPQGPSGLTGQDKVPVTSPIAALAIARQHLGENEIADKGKLSKFFSDNGYAVDPSATAWCAAFVNSSLASAGVKGTGSLSATSFLRWGQSANVSDVKAGDVAVSTRGLRYGQTGGHVGIATGETKMENGRMKVKVLQGNSANSVKEEWEDARGLTIRRAQLLEAQRDANKAGADKLEATGTVNVHLHDSNRNANAKVDTEGMFKDVNVNRGKPMSTAEDYSPLGRAAAGF